MQVLKPEIRQQILETAETLFLQYGFTGTSTRNIAGQAGISASNLYKYFKDKHAIFSAVIDPFYQFIKDDLSDLFTEEHTETGTDIVNTSVEKIMNTIKKDRYKFVILIDRSGGTQYASVKNEITNMIENHMSESINNKEIRDNYILHVIALNFVEGILNIVEKYHDNTPFIENNMEALVRYHMAGIDRFL